MRNWLVGVTVAVLAAQAAFGAAEVYGGFEGANGKAGVESNGVFEVRYGIRDTEGWWFNWRFGVKGAKGYTKTFRIASDMQGQGSGAVGEAGPAFSLDGGRTWRYGCWPKFDKNGFTFAFHNLPGYEDVQFANCLQYDRRHMKEFLAAQSNRTDCLSYGVLATTKGGRKVPLIRLGNLRNPKLKLFFSSRHHANEATATYAIEGIAAAALSDTELGEWIRSDVEIILVPFVDLDGVVQGDQGKNRKPWDHCRDYHLTRKPIYPEVKAIQDLILREKPDVIMDLHNPWVHDDERLYQVGVADKDAAAKQDAFARILQNVQGAGFEYRAEEDVRFGQRWNTGKNFEKGMTLVQWAIAKVGRDAKLITSWEIPFCKAHKKVLGPESFRALGRDLLLAVRRSFGERETWYADELVSGAKPFGEWTTVAPRDAKSGRYYLGGTSANGRDSNFKGYHVRADLSSLTGKYVIVCCRVRGKGTFEMKTDWARGEKTAYAQGRFLLPDQDLPFRKIMGPIPAKADNIAYFETDGYAEFEEPVVLISDARPPVAPTGPGTDFKMPTDCAVGRHLSIPPGETDYAPYAESSSLALLPSRLAMATDGSLGTYELNPFELAFSGPVTLTGFRLTLPPRTLELRADTTGDGRCDTLLYRNWNHATVSTWKDLKEYVWLTHRFEKAVKVHKVLVLAGSVREIELLGPSGQLPGAKPPSFEPADAALAVGAPLEEQPGKPSRDDQYWYGFCLEPWMFGVQNHMTQYFNKGVEPPPFAEWKEWKGLAKDFHELHANFVLLFPPSVFAMPKGVKARPSAYPHPLMWPSKVWYVNQPFDLLSQFNDACHKEGFLDFVIPRGWDFVTNQTEEVKQVTLAKEIAVRGSDGVPMCVDEQYFYMPMDFRKKGEEGDMLRADFFKWSGQTNLPAHAFYGDDRATRLGYLYSVRKKAEWMAEIKAEQMRLNPSAQTFGGFGGCDYWQMRSQYVSGADYWGWEGRCDVIGGDGTYFGVGVEKSGSNLASLTPAVQTAVQVACTPKRQSLATVNFNWGMRWDEKAKEMKNPLVYDDFPNVAHTGGALATYFNKGQYLDYWRYNFMDMKGPKTRAAVRAGGYMAEVLGAWGGKKAPVPKDVLVLRSRTSEDWWMFKWRYGKVDRTEPRSRHQHWPHHLFFWTAARLAENAIPFEIYALQRPEAWRDIARDYKVIVLPFAYSITDDEATALRQAAKAGVKIVVLGGDEAGQVDAIGEPRTANALAGIPVTRFRIADANVPGTGKLAADFVRLVRELAGTTSLAIDRAPGHDVQAFMLSPGRRERLVMVANWSERDTSVNLHVDLPRGSYELEVCDGECVREGEVGGKKTLGPEDAKSFRVDLRREETLLLRIRASGALNVKNWF